MWNGRRDGGIELEVTRRDGSKCHEGSINQLVAGEDGELITIGSDGWVRMWDLTKILSAKPTVEEAAAERPIFRLDPMNQVEVESGAELKSIVRSKERSSADQNIWFIQGSVTYGSCHMVDWFSLAYSRYNLRLDLPYAISS